MESSFVCSFCDASNPRIKETTRFKLLNFSTDLDFDYDMTLSRTSRVINLKKEVENHRTKEGTFVLTFLKCANCGKTEIFAKGISEDVIDTKIKLNPKFSCRKYPDYIPKAIREDYEEACEILTISPKASATLARRCMQGIIRDYWQISGKNLYNEIDMIKEKVNHDVWVALDSLRQLGNIGAHMEKDINLIVDIEPEEADTLIKLIELLIKEWYIARHERQKTLSAIPLINSQKQEQRKS